MMDTSILGKFRSRRAVEAIEYALTAPLFLTMTFGAMELSWLGYQQAALNYAAYQGARTVARDSVNYGKAAGDVLVTNGQSRTDAILLELHAEPTTLFTPSAVGGGPSQDLFAIQATNSYEPLFGSFVPFLSGITELHATTTMHCEVCHNGFTAPGGGVVAEGI